MNPTNSLRPLKPLECPLLGRQLIEASAGTGKTYTIALLFLRLLLQRRLELDQILVVTFTEAATEELRERIRSRLREALEQLRGYAQSSDSALLALLAQLPEQGLGQDQAIRQLEDALVRMDEAMIFTIHGFCARSLRDNAFASGMSFEMEQISDETSLRQAILRDFWRLQLDRIDPAEAAWLLGWLKGPAELGKWLHPALCHVELRIEPAWDFAGAEQLWAELEEEFAELKHSWQSEQEAILALLRAGSLSKTFYRKDYLATEQARMDALCALNRCPFELDASKLGRFLPATLAEKTLEGASTPQHGFFDRFEQFLRSHSQALQARRGAWLREAYIYLRGELRQRKQRLQQLYFDDLLAYLDQGLALANPRGDELAAAVRQRHPVALIDEFQDTDPLQYRIFDRIYPADDPSASLFIIGDPKQAIYSFRGGDIHTYLQAQRHTPPARRFGLDTNWRASSGLVEAINALFQHEGLAQPFGQSQGIDFVPVKPSDRADREPLLIDGMPLDKPLRVWLMPEAEAADKPMGIEVAKDLAANACASEIARLLSLGDAGRAHLGSRPLQARDIAVLVRSADEAKLMQRSLRAWGVASVCRGRESVLQSEQAQELEWVLQAIQQPSNPGLLRAALLTRLMGYSLSELDQLLADDLAIEALQQRFVGYRLQWQRQGFIAALQHWLEQERVAARLLAQADGERLITNLLHLAELLQQAAGQNPGIDNLLHWFARQRQEASEAEELELRLESDEALVKIVTIHSSKGLEYPLVFLPFVWSLKPKTKVDLLLYHDANDRLCLDLGSADLALHQQQAEAERLSESLRLLYVAVTRAKHLCQLCWGRVNEAERSALAWLLHQRRDGEGKLVVEMPQSQQAIAADLAKLGERVELSPLPEPGDQTYQPLAGAQRPLRELRPAAIIRSDWRVTSYSGLIQGLESERPDHDAQTESRGQEPVAGEGIFGFPSGARAGVFLHSLLEHSDFQNLAEAPIQEQMQRHAIEPRWQPVLAQLLADVCATELQPGLRLADISRANRRDELAFEYPLAGLAGADLRGLLAGLAEYRA
ncbi:MAG: exodeoxyribonuclease V subunit beta, partial [Gammaproteobacteria bacterium]|nr:exodeoxyribonuclease V subunit beta [Gammaproteobacteria bacterium]